jgi:serine/threonine protein kinase
LAQRISHYHIQAYIGEGMLGSVYQGYDSRLDRPVALKRLRQSPAEFEQTVLPAVQRTAALSHPHLVRIHDIIVHDIIVHDTITESDRPWLVDQPWLVTEFLPQSLLSQFPSFFQPFALGDLAPLLHLLAQVADTLAYLHEHQIVHGHLKPENVRLKRLDQPDEASGLSWRPMLIDVGLRRAREWDVASHPFLQTVRYWAPEVVLGEEEDGRSDLYSLGVILYQALAGRLPFHIDSLAEAQKQHLTAMPAPLKAIRPHYPDELEDFVQQAIAPDPAARFQTGWEFGQALRQMAEAVASGEFASLRQLAEPGQNVLTIYRDERQVDQVVLDKQMITIGAAEDADVRLHYRDVDPHHARLRRTSIGWTVQDLATATGTYVDELRLLPRRYEDWETTQVLRVGPYLLRWSRGEDIRPSADTGDAAEERPFVEDLYLNVAPAFVTLTPGEQTTLELTLANRGLRVGRFGLVVDKLPSGWYTFAVDNVQLLPGMQETVHLTLHPPRRSTARAGEHPFRLLAYAQANPAQTVAIPATLTLHPFRQMETSLHPAHLRQAGICQFTVTNQGNTVVFATVRGRDRANLLEFGGQKQQEVLEPGVVQPFSLSVAPRDPRPLLGRTQQLPFTVQVEVDGLDNPLSEAGQVEIRPLIPIWVPIFLSTLFTFACIAIGILLTLL